MNELQALTELDKKLLVAKDRIRMVARGQTPGFYWYGRPGTCKTYTVLAVLDELGVKYHYHKGTLTQGGLLEILEEHCDGIIVLDDLSSIFDDKKAVQYFLAALGRQPGRPLPMGHVRQGQHIAFDFTGGIICISNVPVPPKGLLVAFRSRVHILCHCPSDAMLIALARHRICKNGWPSLTVQKVNEVIDWVQAESKRLHVQIDLRVICEKAFPDYLAWKNEETEAHWKDLVTTTLEEEVHSLAYTAPSNGKIGVRQATKEEEWEIVRSILKDFPNRQDRIEEWKRRTNKSEKAFERRWSEVKAQDTSDTFSKSVFADLDNFQPEEIP